MLPTSKFQNKYLDLDLETEEELLCYESIDADIAMFPCYAREVELFSTKVEQERYCRRSQRETYFAQRPFAFKGRLIEDELAGTIKVSFIQAFYIQNDRPLLNPSLLGSILNLGYHPDFAVTELWSSKDWWYINELSVYAPVSIRVGGSPTSVEKQRVAEVAIVDFESQTIPTDPDYRVYRPLAKDIPIALALNYNPNQQTIEALLAPAFKEILEGRSNVRPVVTKSYNTSTLPSGTSNTREGLDAALKTTLVDITPYLIN